MRIIIGRPPLAFLPQRVSTEFTRTAELNPKPEPAGGPYELVVLLNHLHSQ